MKRTILALLLVGSSTALLAQTDTTGKGKRDTTGGGTDTTTSMSSGSTTTMDDGTVSTSRSAAGSYSAYGPVANVPSTIQMSFQNQYPGASDTKWEQSNDWYRVYYKNNGQDMTMYYDAKGQGFMMALPVLQNQVPDDVVAKVKSKYGNNAYDILRIKDANEEDVYQVRILENGEVRTEAIDASGEAVTDLYRTESSEAANMNKNNSMDNNVAPNSTNNNESGITTEMNTTPSSNDATGSDTKTQPDSNTEMNKDKSSETTDDAANNEMKIKAETKEGKEIKIKAKDGEIKVKQDE